MWNFFVEGGISMWVILALGVLLVALSVRFAVRPDRAYLGFIVSLGVAVLASTVLGVVMDVGMVFHFLTDRTRAPDAEFSRILMQGLKESTRPGTLGGGMLVLASIVVAIGFARHGRKDAPAA